MGREISLCYCITFLVPNVCTVLQKKISSEQLFLYLIWAFTLHVSGNSLPRSFKWPRVLRLTSNDVYIKASSLNNAVQRLLRVLLPRLVFFTPDLICLPSTVNLHTSCQNYSKSLANNGCQSQPPLLVGFKWPRVTRQTTYDSWNKSSLSREYCKYRCPVVWITIWLTMHDSSLAI